LRCQNVLGIVPARNPRAAIIVTAAKPDHAALYHRFFSDPAIVAQLLREFVAGAWLEGLDLDAMERLATTFHADDGKRRVGDMVWRIPRRDGGDVYVMLLLEFQSKPDRWMALRMMVYVGLLWQQLVREKRLLPDGKLPPVLPVVLYNGDPRWKAPRVLRELIGLPKTSPLWQWQPGMRYHLIDEGAFKPGDLEGREGLPALLFRLENSPGPGQLVGLADEVLAWFGRHPGFAAARKVLVELLGAAMAPHGQGVRVPDELLEVRNMLATRMEKWMQQQRLEGEQQGRQSGKAALLLRQLERRFGALPDWARDRVLSADTDMMEEWGLRVLDAASLDEVFAGL
jgi:hypothetical protein